MLRRKLKDKSELVPLGIVVKPFGIKGWVKVYSYTNVFENFDRDYLYFLDQKRASLPVPVKIEDFRVHSKNVVLKLEGIDDRDSAEKLRNFQVLIPREDLAPLGEDEFYYGDVIGSEVFVGEDSAGVVVDIIESGASEVLVINTHEGKEVMVPVVEEFVEKIDTRKSRVFLKKGKVEGFFEV